MDDYNSFLLDSPSLTSPDIYLRPTNQSLLILGGLEVMVLGPGDKAHGRFLCPGGTVIELGANVRENANYGTMIFSETNLDYTGEGIIVSLPASRKLQ
ncbi:hypothetical protein ISS07_00155 [Candidatus Woesearchaeota archaeon]|nr:hypothetical protein [Candidatus Woesearchaeota archaeon]